MRWHPYIIDPGTKPEGEEYQAYNRRRWGGDGWTHSMKAMGRKEGAPFGNWKWWPATIQCHRLIKFAEDRGVSSSDSNAAIFQALYEEGQNVSVNEVLTDIAVKLGLDQAEALAFLESDEDRDAVVQQIQEGRSKYKIKGVPFFVVGPEDQSQKPYGLSGAQDSDALLQIFKEFK